MSRSPVDHQALLQELDTVIDLAEEPQADADEIRQGLHGFVVQIPEDKDEEWEFLLMSTETLFSQLNRYSDSFETLSLQQALGEFRDLYEAYLNDNATFEDLEDWRDSTREIVLEERPNTDVIGEHNLEEAFDEAVTRLANDILSAE